MTSAKCKVCRHAQRAAIERELLKGSTLRQVAERFAVSYSSLHRHRVNGHISATLARATDELETFEAVGLAAELNDLKTRTRGILDRAEAADDLRSALGAVRELRGLLELVAKIEGRLSSGGVAVIIASPEWSTLRAVIVAALADHPAARSAVLMAVSELGESDASRAGDL